MSLMQRIAGAFGLGAKPSPTNADTTAPTAPSGPPYGQDILDAFGAGASSPAGQAVTPTSAMRVAAVFACVQKIAGAISTMPLHLYRTDGETPVRMPRDNLWYLLNEQPHPQFTAASFWESITVAQLLRGDGYAWIRRDASGRVRELLPMAWGCVNPVRHTDGSVRYYISLPDYGITTWLDPVDVLHFPGFGFDGLRSMSVISHAARSATGNALAMDEYSGKFFANGAHPSIVLEAPKVLNKDGIERLQAAFVNKYSGADNFHRLPLVLTEGISAKEISLSAQDSQLLEARKFQVIDIARAFGVPPHMIGETSASTSWGSGIEAMSRAFVTYTLQPHLVRDEQELNRKLYPRDTGRFARFDREALTEGDSAAQAEYNRKALGGPGAGMGWMTVDEVRKTKGLPPLGGEAGKVFDPRTMNSKPPKEGGQQ